MSLIVHTYAPPIAYRLYPIHWVHILIRPFFHHDDRSVLDCFSVQCRCSSRGLLYVNGTHKSLNKGLDRHARAYSCWMHSCTRLWEQLLCLVPFTVVYDSEQNKTADDLIVRQWHYVSLSADTKEVKRKASGELRPPPIGNALKGVL